MYQFINHRIVQKGDGLEIILYLDTQSTEFAKEFGDQSSHQGKEDLEESARNYVGSKFPNLKKATVKVMAGSVMVASLAFGGVSAVGATPMTPVDTEYSDVTPNSYYSEAAEVLTEKGITEGIGGDKFAPDQEITRAEVAMMLARSMGLDGLDKTEGEPVFDDVENGWYYGAIAALKDANVINGYKGTFKPNDPITRSELAKMVAEAYDMEQNKDADLPFTDIDDDVWFRGYIAPLVSAGITQGVGGDQFAPERTTTRAEAATLVYRAINVDMYGTADGHAAIEDVSDDSVTINGNAYNLSDDVTGILNAANADVLKDATIYAPTDKDGQVYSIRHLEISASGSDTAALTLDGGDTVVNGPLIVSGDYLSLQNIKVNGDLIVTGDLENSLTLNNVTVNGDTILEGDTANMARTAAVDTTDTTSGKITVKDSVLGNFIMNRANFELESNGSTFKKIEVNANAVINADDNSTIPQLVVQDGVSNVEVNGNIEKLEIKTTAAVTVTGKATIDSVKLPNTGDVTLGVVGKIVNLVAPDGGADAADVVKNFDEVKQNIEKIGGEDNDAYVAGDEGNVEPGGVGEQAPPAIEQIGNKIEELTNAKTATALTNAIAQAQADPDEVTALNEALGKVESGTIPGGWIDTMLSQANEDIVGFFTTGDASNRATVEAAIGSAPSDDQAIIMGVYDTLVAAITNDADEIGNKIEELTNAETATALTNAIAQAQADPDEVTALNEALGKVESGTIPGGWIDTMLSQANEDIVGFFTTGDASDRATVEAAIGSASAEDQTIIMEVYDTLVAAITNEAPATE